MTFHNLTASPVWIAAGWTMVHMIWVGAIAGLVAACLRWSVRFARPEVRYRVAMASLLAIGVCPMVTFSASYQPVAVPVARITKAADLPMTIERISMTEEAVSPGRLAAMNVPSISRAESSRTSRVVIALPWIWLVGSALTVALLGTGLVGVERLRRASIVLRDGPIVEACRRLAPSLGIARKVTVGVCDRLTSPVLIGILRPLILLPPAALSGWSPSQIEMVLLHELTHLKRRDNLVNLVQRLIEALLFFHPAAWWISRWVRLERERCCDREVIHRVSEPRLYAEMLLMLASSRPNSGVRTTMAMAEGQVVARIRSLFHQEDRSMSMSLPEGFGALGTLVVAASLAIAARADDAPKPASPTTDVRREVLRKAVESLESLPYTPNPGGDYRGQALLSVARSQIKIGDREAGLATLQVAFKAYCEPLEKPSDNEVKRVAAYTVNEDGSKREISPRDLAMDRLSDMVAIATLQREAGALAAARASLDLMTTMIEARPVPQLTRSKIAPVPGDANGTMRIDEESEAMAHAEILAYLAQERASLGDAVETRRLVNRAIEMMQGEPEALRAIVLLQMTSFLQKVGDLDEARDLIQTARGLVDLMNNAEEKAAAMTYVVGVLAEIGDLDGAIEIAHSMTMPRQLRAFELILEAVAKEDSQSSRVAYIVPGGIKLSTIGAEGYEILDPVKARAALPRIAEAVRQTGRPELQIPMMSTIAHLQARAGDFAGACETAQDIPVMNRDAAKIASLAFTQAVQAATYARIAREQAAAGDKPAALNLIRIAIDLARQSIDDPGEREIAFLVIASEQSEMGEKAASLALLQETEKLAQSLSEPRRSRSLAMIVHRLIGSGALELAEATTETIRAYPILEKESAYQAIGAFYERSNQTDKVKIYSQKILDELETKPPADFKPGPVVKLGAISSRTPMDPDAEYEPAMGLGMASSSKLGCITRLHGTDAALQFIAEMPFPQLMSGGVVYASHDRNMNYVNLASFLVQRGDLAGAEKVLAAIEPAGARAKAIEMMAYSIASPPAK